MTIGRENRDEYPDLDNWERSTRSSRLRTIAALVFWITVAIGISVCFGLRLVVRALRR